MTRGDTTGRDHARRMADLGLVQKKLEEQWDVPDGFFYRLRHGDYHPPGVDVVEELLMSLDVDDKMQLPRRFVSLTWWIPTFMEWQIDRVREKGGDSEAMKRDITRLFNVLNKVLGVP